MSGEQLHNGIRQLRREQRDRIAVTKDRMTLTYIYFRAGTQQCRGLRWTLLQPALSFITTLLVTDDHSHAWLGHQTRYSVSQSQQYTEHLNATQMYSEARNKINNYKKETTIHLQKPKSKTASAKTLGYSSSTPHTPSCPQTAHHTSSLTTAPPTPSSTTNT